MVLQSILIGIIFGIIWANMFVKQHKQTLTTKTEIPPFKPHFIPTSLIRYLLLIVALVFLLAKKYIAIGWWLAGFLVTFWGALLFLMTMLWRGKK